MSGEEVEPFPGSDSDAEYIPPKKKSLIHDYFNVRDFPKKNTLPEKENPGPSRSNEDNSTNEECSASTSGSVTPSESGQVEILRRRPLLDGKFFKILSIQNNNLLVKCALCVPKNVDLKATCSSTSNLLKHLKTKHQESMTAYEKHKSNSKGKKDKPSSDSLKVQATTGKILTCKKGRQPNQSEFDKKLINFFVQTMSPLSIIEHGSFRDLFLNSNYDIMSRRTLVRRLDEDYKDTINNIKEKLIHCKYVCTTADIWSAKSRSFMGVTCHWIGEDLERESFALACRRFTGTHSFDRIADILEDIHLSFNLNNTKIVATITDNGSNFVKAFKEFGLRLNLNNDVSDDDHDEYIGEEDEWLTQESMETLLPKHFRCASHTLNLLATTDIKNALEKKRNFKMRHDRVLQKCSLLWNKAGRPKSAEIIKNILGHTLSYPSITRWNSFYTSINQILEEKNKLDDLFSKLEIKDSLKGSDILYLEEYCAILKPIADALNFLQGEKNTYYGYLLPSVITVSIKLEKLKTDTCIRNLQFLVDKLHEKLIERFPSMFIFNEDSKEAIIASVTLPSVKLRWLNVFKKYNPEFDSNFVVKLIVKECACIFSSDILDTPDAGGASNDNENDFFDFNEETKESNDCVQTENTGIKEKIKTVLELELLKYIEDKRTCIEVLNEFKLIKNIFIRYNCSLPSSAAVERLFSFATYINSPRRHALSDDLFEKLVFLKANSFSKM